MLYILSALTGYLLGSIPTAYLILKKTRSIDITAAGTGNVGAMNAYEVTNSKRLGIIIFLLDALKGLLSVYLMILFLPLHFIFPALALLFAVIGHSYSPWLQFKGGRGLSTALGGLLLISPLMPLIWGIGWIISYIIKKEIIISNFLATLFTILIIFLNLNFIFRFSFPSPDSLSTLLMFTASLLMLIMIKHFEPLKSLIMQNENTKE